MSADPILQLSPGTDIQIPIKSFVLQERTATLFCLGAFLTQNPESQKQRPLSREIVALGADFKVDVKNPTDLG